MLKNGKPFGKAYFDELLEKIREIRASERVDEEHPTMGLTTWKDAPDGKILKRDVSVVKNYVNENEIKK